MSAVPKRKLCWHCEGNVARDIDNCPYCGVYLQATETEAMVDPPIWNPSYHPTGNKTEEIPLPVYQINPTAGQVRSHDLERHHSLENESEQEYENERGKRSLKGKEVESLLVWSRLFAQVKQDVLPILFLMMGSVFFLFGIVLFMFSQEGTLTLQWQEKHGVYFLIFALPLMILGWKFLQQLDSD